MRGQRTLIGIGVAPLLIAAAPAHAGTASVGLESGFSGSGYAIRFAEAPGERNAVTFSDAPEGAIRVTDGGARVTPGDGCVSEGDGVVCAAPEWGITRILAELGDGDDSASGAALAHPPDVALHGGEGDDRLAAASSGRIDANIDPQMGTFANLDGGPGDDVLLGGAGDDQFDAGTGADTIRGAAGEDLMGYADAPAGVVVTLDDRPGDGPPGEGDDIGSDVEAVRGSAGSDTITGSDGPNELEGLDGADVLDGRGGADLLVTGRGGDRLIGGPGPDVFDAEVWDTQVHARDGERDRVECGARVVMLSMDPFDSLAQCAPAAARPRYSRLRVRRSGTAGLLLGCQERTDIPCAGKILVRRKLADDRRGPVVGRGRFRIPSGGSAARASVRVSGSFMRLLARRGRIDAEAELITLRDRPRSSRTVPMALELLAPR